MLSDDEFVRQFEAATLPDLPHRDHVRLTVIYQTRYERAQALERIADGIRRFATAKGAPDKFHVTITRAWFELIESARAAHPDARDASALVAACPQLLDSQALLRFYSRERLASVEAKASWVPPDLSSGDTRIMCAHGECRSDH